MAGELFKEVLDIVQPVEDSVPDETSSGTHRPRDRRQGYPRYRQEPVRHVAQRPRLRGGRPRRRRASREVPGARPCAPPRRCVPVGAHPGGVRQHEETRSLVRAHEADSGYHSPSSWAAASSTAGSASSAEPTRGAPMPWRACASARNWWPAPRADPQRRLGGAASTRRGRRAADACWSTSARSASPRLPCARRAKASLISANGKVSTILSTGSRPCSYHFDDLGQEDPRDHVATHDELDAVALRQHDVRTAAQSLLVDRGADPEGHRRAEELAAATSHMALAPELSRA